MRLKITDESYVDPELIIYRSKFLFIKTNKVRVTGRRSRSDSGYVDKVSISYESEGEEYANTLYKSLVNKF